MCGRGGGGGVVPNQPKIQDVCPGRIMMFGRVLQTKEDMVWEKKKDTDHLSCMARSASHRGSVHLCMLQHPYC